MIKVKNYFVRMHIFTYDDTPPAVTVSYSGGTYTLTVSDNKSGVWKITNSDGTVVYRDYSG